MAKQMQTEGLPLDQKFTETKSGSTEPMLNVGLVKPISYWLYKPPSLLLDSEEQLKLINDHLEVSEERPDIAEWCQNAQSLITDLREILELPYPKLWAHAIYDHELQLSLDSFIRLAPRWFDLCPSGSPQMEFLHDQLYDTVIKVFMRMSTSRESKDDHLSPDKFAEVLLDHFDLARLVDISTLFGMARDEPENPIVKKMISNILTKQPAILKELDLFVESVQETMTDLKLFCETSDVAAAPTAQPSLRDIANFKSSPSLRIVEEDRFLLICQAATEVPVSVLHFVRHSPPEVLEGVSDVIHALPDFFGTVFDALEEEIERRKTWSARGADRLREILRIGQSCSLALFRYFVEKTCLEKFERSVDSSEAAEMANRCQMLLMEAVADGSFMLAYNSLYRVEDDFDLFRRNPLMENLLDEEYLKYLSDTVKTIIGEANRESGDTVFGEKVQLEGAVGYGAEVANVKNIFPDMDSRFIAQCLDFYKGNVDELVMALMDENLHPELVKMREELKEEKPASPVSEEGEVHIGKKNKLNETVDIEDRERIKEVVMRYRDVSEVVVDDKLYDDEYDDTYDSMMVGMPESEEAENRNFETPRILQDRGERQKKHWEMEQPEEELTEEELKKKKAAFCEDPEVVRARREQRYQSRGAARGRPTRDVVGAAKGQGQSDAVLRNRAVKEKHKGGNRRAQADRKRKEF